MRGAAGPVGVRGRAGGARAGCCGGAVAAAPGALPGLRVTHVLLPVSALSRRADLAEVIWLRRKYKRGSSQIGMPELRDRFCVPGTWQFADNGVRFTGASIVPVARYRYRGSTIPAPYPPQPAPAPS